MAPLKSKASLFTIRGWKKVWQGAGLELSKCEGRKTHGPSPTSKHLFGLLLIQ